MSNIHEIISATSFDAERDIKFTKPKINKSGGKSVGILNKHNKQLLISTPIILTWGVNEFVDEQSGKKSYNMALQFPNDNYITEQNTKFLENIKAFENKLKQEAVTNSKEWMNKSKLSAEVIDALFTPMLKYPKDKNSGEPDYTRAPSLNVKIGFWKDEFDCEVYDHGQTQLFPGNDATKNNLMSLIPKSANIACILKCGGLWFANGKFGCTWKLVQAAVKPRESIKGKCFISFPGDEISKNVDSEASPKLVSSSSSLELVNDSEDEEEEEEKEVQHKQEITMEVTKEIEKTIPLVVATTKKIVRRKATATSE